MAQPNYQFWWNQVKIRQLMQDKANEELEKLARFVFQRMQVDVPKRTGRLFRSIRYVHDWANLIVRFTIAAPYAVYVEFGTRYMSPRVYIRSALAAAAQYWNFGRVQIVLHPPAQKSEPLRAYTGGFYRPKVQKLTPVQERHVRKNLTPVSKFYAHEFKRRKVRYSVKGP